MRTLVIHTGGTIGMVQTAEGYAPQLGIVEDCLVELHSMNKITGDFELVVADPLIDSGKAMPHDWNWIGGTISDHYNDFDAFVVTHGSDTMAFTSCALSYALEGLDKPVILTGSMLPLTVQNNDGLRNLTDAMNAVHDAGAGVWVQFAGRRLHGTRVRKSHSSAFDAFHDAAMDVPARRIVDAFKWQTYSTFNVPVLAFTPGMDGEILEHCAERADGIVLRCYGSGTVPDLPELAPALGLAKKRHVPVIATSQCAEGGVALGTYAAGAALLEAGVIDGRDATVEAVYTKLLYGLSKDSSECDLRSTLAAPICGEFARTILR
ncbi:L-asparaginase 1 [Roseovarius albus]|uniref:L-asparaginase 1 n=1 Tax=Roseovarius albus TaxID=1247867 RepID=A0A1X6YY21_9RHOB|nr:asparaginase [Roseovarius albus]SLN34209.1 L-asparaginase 1 [Roseovarius albus]